MIIDILTIILLYLIFVYGSVFETQYNEYVYLFGDEKWVILLYVVCSLYLLYVDIKLAILFMLMGFFITNDVPIINRALFNDSFQNKEEELVNDSIEDVRNYEEKINGFLNDIKMEDKLEMLTSKLDSYYLTLKEQLKIK